MKRTAPLKDASRSPLLKVPSPSGKRKRAPPSSAPDERVHLPWAMSPVTYSRKVRRTPQSTAPSLTESPGVSFFAGDLEALGVLDGVAAAGWTSADRLTGSSAVPAV